MTEKSITTENELLEQLNNTHIVKRFNKIFIKETLVPHAMFKNFEYMKIIVFNPSKSTSFDVAYSLNEKYVGCKTMQQVFDKAKATTKRGV